MKKQKVKIDVTDLICASTVHRLRYLGQKVEIELEVTEEAYRMPLPDVTTKKPSIEMSTNYVRMQLSDKGYLDDAEIFEMFDKRYQCVRWRVLHAMPVDTSHNRPQGNLRG